MLVIPPRLRYNVKKEKVGEAMERRGFIHDMLDVKVLILFVMSRVLYPIDAQKIYELCYQDECLSYFDVQTALPEMIASGHLEQTQNDFVITEKGRDACSVTEDSIAYPVAQRAQRAVDQFNRAVRRDSFIHAQVLPRQSGDFSVIMGLDDEMGNLMTLELVAPTQTQGRRLSEAFHKNADTIFRTVMQLLTEEERPAPSEEDT